MLEILKDTREKRPKKSYAILGFTCLFSLISFLGRIRLLVCVSIVLSFARRVWKKGSKKKNKYMYSVIRGTAVNGISRCNQ